MALNIPMPNINQWGDLTKGVNSGTNLFNSLINPVLKREQLGQEHTHQQDQKAYQYKALEQAWNQHMNDLALRQQAEGRHQQEFDFNKQLQPLNLELLKAKIQHEQAKAQQPMISEEEKAYQRAKGTGRARQIGENNEQIGQATDLENSLVELQNIANSNPKLFNETIGPIASKYNKYAGTPEQKELLGNIKAASGNVMLSTLQLMKGASSDKEMAEVKEIKPSESDTPEAYRAKAQTLLKVAEQIKNRKIAINQLLENGYSSTQAVKAAMDAFPVTSLIKGDKRSSGSNNMSSSGMLTGVINGDEVPVHPSNIDDFIANGGKMK